MAKRPGIPGRRNLEQLRRSLEEGVEFSWLLYDSPAARELWPNYLAELRALGISPERLRSQIRCRWIPSALGARGIDWRISIFGEQIALCSFAPDLAASAAGAQTFTLDRPGELRDAFVRLFDLSSPDGAAERPPNSADIERQRAAHTELKTAFLRSFQQGLPTDIMLHRLEEASLITDRLLAQTRQLIWVSVLTLVAVVATLALTQVRLP